MTQVWVVFAVVGDSWVQLVVARGACGGVHAVRLPGPRRGPSPGVRLRNVERLDEPADRRPDDRDLLWMVAQQALAPSRGTEPGGQGPRHRVRCPVVHAGGDGRPRSRRSRPHRASGLLLLPTVAARGTESARPGGWNRARQVFGLYMGCSFAPDHTGMPIVPANLTVDFLHRQVLMSRNIRGGRWMTFLFGGLNYQIKHHLLPSMPRPNLRRACEIVRPFCQELASPTPRPACSRHT
jgi:Fatty acid desaturase